MNPRLFILGSPASPRKPSALAELPNELLAQVVARLRRLSELAALGASNKRLSDFTEPILNSVRREIMGGVELDDFPDQARFVLPFARHMYVRELLHRVEQGRFPLGAPHLQALIACVRRQPEGLRLRQLLAAQRLGGKGMDHQVMLDYLAGLSRHSPREAMSALLPHFRHFVAGDPYQRLGMQICNVLLMQAGSPETLVEELLVPAGDLPAEDAAMYLTGLLKLARLPHFADEFHLDQACGALAQPVLNLPSVLQPPALMALFDLGLAADELPYNALLSAWLDCAGDNKICRLHRMWHALPSVLGLATRVLDDAHCLAFCRTVLAQADSLLSFGSEDVETWVQGRRDGWPHVLCRWIRSLADEALRASLWYEFKAICDANQVPGIGLEEIMGAPEPQSDCRLV